MSELKPRITENGIDYILVGDYYIPDLKLPKPYTSTVLKYCPLCMREVKCYTNVVTVVANKI